MQNYVTVALTEMLDCTSSIDTTQVHCDDMHNVNNVMHSVSNVVTAAAALVGDNAMPSYLLHCQPIETKECRT